MDSTLKNKDQLMQHMLQNHLLNRDSHLYRFTTKTYLKESANGLELIANPNPQEMIINQYEGGYNTMAKEIGMGLAFAKEIHEDFKANNKTCVKVRIGDLLDQGALIYQVVSVPEYIKAFFFTIPNGKVNVENIT